MEICDTHHHPAGICITKGKCKDCEKPFALYCLSSVLKNGEKRKLWVKALKRENKETAWLPGYSDRVCSIHFIDGILAAAPTLNLVYEKEAPKSRRELFCQPLQKKSKKEKNQQTLIDTTENCSYDEINIDCGCENTVSIIATKHRYCKLESDNVCLTCVDKSNLIKPLVEKLTT